MGFIRACPSRGAPAHVPVSGRRAMQQRSVPALDTVSASRKRKLLASILAVPLVSGLSLSEARAAEAYWDTNADTAGAGTNPGTWGLDAFWTTDATGSTTPTNAWTADDFAIFSAGDDLTGAYTATLNGTQAASGIRLDRKSTRLNSSNLVSSYAVFCLK